MGVAADGWIRLATEMIAQYGETTGVVLTKPNAGTYSTSTLAPAAGSPATYNFWGAPVDFKIRDIDKVTIMTGEKLLYLPGTTKTGATVIPEVGDTVTFANSDVFRVLEVTSYDTESVSCAFLLKIGV